MADSTERLGESYEILDKPHEECGVVGAYAPGEALSQLGYQALQQLQHRGQDGAGLTISTPGNRGIDIYSDLGLVRDVFNRGERLSALDLKGTIMTGHTRYATSSTPIPLQRLALQPMLYEEDNRPETLFSLAHNGHIEDLSRAADRYGIATEGQASDTAVMTNIIGKVYANNGNLGDALSEVLPQIEGAFSLVLSTRDKLYAARDRHGYRPLQLGKFAAGGWAVASEVAALDIMRAEPFREVEGGEIITISGIGPEGLTSQSFANSDPTLCGFEFVYFSRPDNVMFGEPVARVRERMGAMLAEGDDVQADMVIGVPESGLFAADGYGRARNLPHNRYIVRNNYVDRSFIAPSQDARRQGVITKLNVIGPLIKGMRIVIVDDSIVRGTTQSELIKILREAGAAEVHVRISSPAYVDSCHWGMDTGRPEELIAANKSVAEIAEYIGADSLKYLTNEQMQRAVGNAAGRICTVCTTSIEPVALRNPAKRVPQLL